MFIAVASDKTLQHGWNRQNSQYHPDKYRNLRRMFQNPYDFPLPRMDYAKISVNGDDRQEGDAGSPVKKLQKELYFAHYLIFTALLKVIRLYRQSNQQQNVSQDQIEQENVNGFRFPELELEDEEMDNCNVQQETQDKLQNYHRRVENIQRSVIFYVLLTVDVRVVCVVHICVVCNILKIPGPNRFLTCVDTTPLNVCSPKAELFKAART